MWKLTNERLNRRDSFKLKTQNKMCFQSIPDKQLLPLFLYF